MDAVQHKPAAATSKASISTKVTVIVFWGLIIAGLLFATLLLRNSETATRDVRSALADSIAYQVHQFLHEHEHDPAALKEMLGHLLEARDDIGVSVHIDDRDFVEYGAAYADPQLFTRSLGEVSDTDTHTGQISVRFPNLEQTLHAERSRLLLSLGALLLLFGVVLKGLLERVLTLPMAEMVNTARRISEGQIDASFASNRSDEFGYLSFCDLYVKRDVAQLKQEPGSTKERIERRAKDHRILEASQ